MPELLQEMYYGPNVQNLIESDDCKVMRLSDNSGEGMMTLYHVFPGVFLMYNDFHMKECVSGFQTDMDLLCFGWIAASIIRARWSFRFATTTVFPLAFKWKPRQRKSQPL